MICDGNTTGVLKNPRAHAYRGNLEISAGWSFSITSKRAIWNIGKFRFFRMPSINLKTADPGNREIAITPEYYVVSLVSTVAKRHITSEILEIRRIP